MTTYAPPPVLAPDQTPAYWQTTPPGGGLPPRPLRTGGRRRGVVAAWVAVAAAAAAVAVSAVNLSDNDRDRRTRRADIYTGSGGGGQEAGMRCRGHCGRADHIVAARFLCCPP